MAICATKLASSDLRFALLKSARCAVLGARIRKEVAHIPAAETSRRERALACIAALLCDIRKGAPHSLASVILFLPCASGHYEFVGRYRLVHQEYCYVKMLLLQTYCGNVAVTANGELVMTDFAAHDVLVYTQTKLEKLASQVHGRYTNGKSPLQFAGPRQVCVSPDGFVFIAEQLNRRIQILTPAFQFHAFIDACSQANEGPVGVCADMDFVIVRSKFDIAVFRRTGEFVRRIRDVHLNYCVTALLSFANDRVLPRANYFACVRSRPVTAMNRITIYTVEGAIVREWDIPRTGSPLRESPISIAVSPRGELVAATRTNNGMRIDMWNEEGQPHMSVDCCEDVDGVTVLNGTVIAYSLLRDRDRRGATRHRSKSRRHRSYIQFMALF
jgi:hypothetical protein